MTNLDAEELAFDLLQWVPYCLPSQYDEEQAMLGYYSKTQKDRSDRAIDAWDDDHPYKSSDELEAFKQLERLGVYTQADFYSPSKAKNGHYAQRLREHRTVATSVDGPSSTRGNIDPVRKGTGLDAPDAKQGFRPRRARRRTRS